MRLRPEDHKIQWSVMQKFNEFADATQFDSETKMFRKTYLGCHTCLPIERINLEQRKMSVREWINQLLISIRLSRL
jgi:hypothetical protein